MFYRVIRFSVVFVVGGVILVDRDFSGLRKKQQLSLVTVEEKRQELVDWMDNGSGVRRQ